MSKRRAYGADATLKVAREAEYGTPPASGFHSLDFKSTDLSSSIPLGDDPLLGRGRNAQDPYRGLVTDEGEFEIPFDLQGTGFWMTGLFGDPVTTSEPATGSIRFADNPSPGDTITLNGVIWTFVATAPESAETEIQGALSETLDELASDLNASAEPDIAQASYTVDSEGEALLVEHDTAGPAGNAFALEASVAVRSAPTLTGGGYRHVWESGSDAIPSFLMEIGHPKLTTPVWFRHGGGVMESLAFDMGQEGPANGTIMVVAQGEEAASATIAASPSTYQLRRFSQGRGRILRGGEQLAGVTAGSLSFSNTLERVRVIREDGKIEGADPTIATCEGQMTVRFDGETLVAEAGNGDPVSLLYGFSMGEGYELTFELPRVFLPKSKYSITGPGGVETSFEWRAAYDEATGMMLRVSLLNDVPSYGGA